MNSSANIKQQGGQCIGVNLTLFPEVRQGFQPLPHSSSPLKRTE